MSLIHIANQWQAAHHWSLPPCPAEGSLLQLTCQVGIQVWCRLSWFWILPREVVLPPWLLEHCTGSVNSDLRAEKDPSSWCKESRAFSILGVSMHDSTVSTPPSLHWVALQCHCEDPVDISSVFLMLLSLLTHCVCVWPLSARATAQLLQLCSPAAPEALDTASCTSPTWQPPFSGVHHAQRISEEASCRQSWAELCSMSTLQSYGPRVFSVSDFWSMVSMSVSHPQLSWLPC